MKRKYHAPLRPITTVSFLILITLSIINPAYGLGDQHSYAFEEKLLSYINQYRVENALSPLSFDETLHNSARNHSQHMYNSNDLNHDNFDERYRQCGRLVCVENVGWNYPTPDAQFKAWKKSRDHNRSLLNKKIKYAGISKVGAYVTFFACN